MQIQLLQLNAILLLCQNAFACDQRISLCLCVGGDVDVP